MANLPADERSPDDLGDDEDVCEHGVPFDEDCDGCEEEAEWQLP